MDVLDTATKNTNKKMGEWLNVQLNKNLSNCTAKTKVSVDYQKHEIAKIYIDKATVNWSLSPRITKAILYKSNGKRLTINKD